MALPGSERTRRIATVVFFAVALIIHAHRCVALFTPAGSLFSDQPLLTDDNGTHSYYALVGAQLIAKTGRPYGYVPDEMAGHPKTAIYDAGIGAVERLMAALPSIHPFVVYKLFVLLSMAAIALCPLFALLLLGLRGRSWAFGWASLLFVYWWGQGMVFTMGGMNSWLLSASLSLLLLTAAVRLTERWAWPLATLVGALICIDPFIHPVGSVSAVVSAILLLAARPRDLKRTGLFVLGCGCLALLINYGWLSSAWASRHIGTARDAIMGGSETPLRLASTTWAEIRESPSRVKTFNRVVVALFQTWLVLTAAISLRSLWRRKDRRFVPLALPFLILGLLTFFSGASAALQNIQPWRLRFLWLLLVGALAALQLAEWLRAGGVRKGLAIATGLFACGYFLAFDARPDIARLQIGFDPVEQSWLATLNGMADDRARVLIEDGPGYRGLQPAALHLGTHTQWIGGPFIAAWIKHHEVRFVSGRLVDRRLTDWTPDQLSRFLRTYNVHWIVAWSDDTKVVLNHSGLVRPVREVGGLAFYELVAPTDSFFERGSGDLQAALDGITLSHVVADNESVVIRYHYDDQLVVEGGRALRPFPIAGDPVGFIEVLEPTSRVNIHGKHLSGARR